MCVRVCLCLWTESNLSHSEDWATLIKKPINLVKIFTIQIYTYSYIHSCIILIPRIPNKHEIEKETNEVGASEMGPGENITGRNEYPMQMHADEFWVSATLVMTMVWDQNTRHEKHPSPEWRYLNIGSLVFMYIYKIFCRRYVCMYEISYIIAESLSMGLLFCFSFSLPWTFYLSSRRWVALYSC